MADYTVDVDHGGAMAVTTSLLGLENVDVTVHVPEKVASDTTVRVADKVRTDTTVRVPEPVAVSSTVDVQPVALDQCVRVVLGPLPPTRVRTPWEQRFAVRVLGVELFSATLSGETTTYLEPAPRRPRVEPADSAGLVVRLGEG